MTTTRSGNGWRTTIGANGEPEVSIWAHTESDAEYMSAQAHMRLMERQEDERVKVELAFAEQQRAEHRKIRARA